MTLISFDQLPTSLALRLQAYKAINIQLNNFGGKKLISLPEVYVKEAIDSQCFSLNLNLLWTIRAKDLALNMSNIEGKLLKKKLPECDLVYKASEYKGREEDLFTFKKAHALFVTPDKIKEGIYSPDAEKNKIKNATQCTLQTKEGEILASLLLFYNKSTAYAADFIVSTEHRQQGLGELICLLAYKAFMTKESEIQNIAYIAGGDGAKGWCKTFYTETLSSKNHEDARAVIAAEKGKSGLTKMGVFASFGAPGALMMNASAKSKKSEIVSGVAMSRLA